MSPASPLFRHRFWGRDDDRRLEKNPHHVEVQRSGGRGVRRPCGFSRKGD